MFDTMRAGGHESLHFHRDPASGLQAIIAIHDTRRGPALGGCRFITYPDENAALDDALRLSRGMTLKAVLADVPQGGGKAVILKPSGPFDREALFAAFGRLVDSLGGRYISAIDSGTGTGDMAVVARHTRHVTSVSEQLDPSPWTALGVFRGIEAAVSVFLKRADLHGLTVAMQGLGHVGYPLARRLHDAGARLFVADIDSARVARAVQELGATPVVPEQVHATACDVFVPCGLGNILNPQTIPALACRIVAGSANNQLADADCARQLQARGIHYAPDYVINAGGLIFASLQYNGRPQSEIEDKTNRIGETLRRLFQRALAGQVSPHDLAEQMAREVLEGHDQALPDAAEAEQAQTLVAGSGACYR